MELCCCTSVNSQRTTICVLRALNNWWFDKKYWRYSSSYALAFRAGETEIKVMNSGVVATSFGCHAVLILKQDGNLLKMCSCLLCGSVLWIITAALGFLCAGTTLPCHRVAVRLWGKDSPKAEMFLRRLYINFRNHYFKINASYWPRREVNKMKIVGNISNSRFQYY